jgi:hypothetical protein
MTESSDSPRIEPLSRQARAFLNSLRPEQQHNLALLANLREEEYKAMDYLVRNFSVDDLKTLNESMENLRTMRRAGGFAFWLVGLLGTGAAAAAYVKGWMLK